MARPWPRGAASYSSPSSGAPRGIEPPCAACSAGQVGNCGHVAFGHIRPGLQTGFCADTGGGWSSSGLVAHESQLYAVPDALSDADAVTVEPVACAVHAVLGAPIEDGDVVAIVGAGTLGLLVTAALTHLAATGRCAAPAVLLVGARYGHQQRLARAFGCTEALAPEQLSRAVRRHTRVLSYGGSPGIDRNPVRGRRRGDRLRGQRRVDRAVAGHGAPEGDRVARRDAGPGQRGPGAALAP